MVRHHIVPEFDRVIRGSASQELVTNPCGSRTFVCTGLGGL